MKQYVLNEVERAVEMMGPDWVVGRLRSNERPVEVQNMRAESPREVRAGLTDADVEDIFTYHDNPEAVPHYVEVREGAKTFAKILLRHVPVCPDQSAMLRKLREVVMTANAGIALGGKY